MNTGDRNKLAALKHEIAAGMDALDHGRFQTYTEVKIRQLADDTGRTGRIRLNGLRTACTAEMDGKNEDFCGRNLRPQDEYRTGRGLQPVQGREDR